MAVSFLLSGFFSGAETALFSFRAHELGRMKDGSALDRLVAGLRERPKRLLSTVLFGNMVVNVVFFSVSYQVAQELRPRIGETGVLLVGLGALLAIVVGGEVMPKSLAVLFRRPYGRIAAPPLFVLEKLLLVVLVPLQTLAHGAATLLGGGGPVPVEEDELRMLVSMGAREGVLDSQAERMIGEVLELSDVPVREVMIPRTEMTTFDLEDSREELLERFRREKLTTIPVFRGSMDNMLGVVHIKDVLFRTPDTDLSETVRPILFIPESATVEAALRQCREEATKTAFVVDEYGAVVGLVTVEDMLEEIVGEIADEYDEEASPPIEALDDGLYRVRGDLSLREWCEAMELPLPDLDVDTVSGLVMALSGGLPEEGRSVRFRGLELTVERSTGRRAETVLVRFLDEGGG